MISALNIDFGPMRKHEMAAIDGDLHYSRTEAVFEEAQMIKLFSKLMEPGLYPQYLRMNKKFYSHFCRL